MILFVSEILLTNGLSSSIDLNLFPASMSNVKFGQPSRFSNPELKRLSLR